MGQILGNTEGQNSKVFWKTKLSKLYCSFSCILEYTNAKFAHLAKENKWDNTRFWKKSPQQITYINGNKNLKENKQRRGTKKQWLTLFNFKTSSVPMSHIMSVPYMKHIHNTNVLHLKIQEWFYTFNGLDLESEPWYKPVTVPNLIGHFINGHVFGHRWHFALILGDHFFRTMPS